MSVSIGGTTGVTFSDASVQNTAATGFGFKNRIINGAMMIDQRNAGASVNVSNANTYTLDRWIPVINAGAGGVFTAQRSTTAPSGFINSLSLTTQTADSSIAASEYYFLSQRIEGFNTADLGWGTASASTVTLSFWVRSSLTGTFSGGLRNNAANRSYVFSYTINSANTWEQKSVTIVGDTTGTWATDNSIGVEVSFDLGSGTSYNGTSGAWSSGNYFRAAGAVNLVGTLAATFYITGVQLEKGSTATSFDYRPYGTELALCQRYFQIYNAPGNFSSWGAGRQTSTTASRIFANYPAMRSSPTAAIGGNVSLDYPNGSTAIIAITGQYLSTYAGFVDVSHASVGAIGYGVGIQMSSTGLANFFSLSSEL